ncbi:hypothetical protein EJ04DRAFT_515087 [Polyplosphaeria fusca]|uniref:Uncharacterized protein n=1 Tax=Polyplosphaeria fusca TaxID=682080 RepID=A0A9P4QS36_9PLEO|nr:hypothetical protein EJ04DRAFT_515087 [Polyplosphaeria fusca]
MTNAMPAPRTGRGPVVVYVLPALSLAFPVLSSSSLLTFTHRVISILRVTQAVMSYSHPT